MTAVVPYTSCCAF